MREAIGAQLTTDARLYRAEAAEERMRPDPPAPSGWGFCDDCDERVRADTLTRSRDSRNFSGVRCVCPKCRRICDSCGEGRDLPAAADEQVLCTSCLKEDK